MELTKAINVIYMSVMIIVLIVIMVFIISAYMNHEAGGNYNHVSPPEEPQFLGVSSRKNKTAPIARKYDNPDVSGMDISNKVEKEEPAITFEDFKQKARTVSFAKQLEDSIRRSFREKRKIYSEKLDACRKEYASRRGRTFGNSDHDIQSSRLLSIMTEINSILGAIKSRLEKLDHNQVLINLSEAINNPTHGMASIVGRNDVKNFLSLQLCSFAKNPKTFFTNFQNILIYGDSGVGKTKLAETIAYVYATSGILVRSRFKAITKQDVTTAYVNESGNLMRDALYSTLEGILFIDEAYAMTPESCMPGIKQKDHGAESIEELVNFTDKNMGLSVIVAAGYENEMEERFVKANQGLDRRFAHKLRLKGYNSEQLCDLFLSFLNSTSPEIKVSDRAANYIHSTIYFLMKKIPNIFSKQAGDMLLLSNCFLRIIYGSHDVDWVNFPESQKDDQSNRLLIKKGFNEYLKPKGKSVVIEEICTT